MKLPQTPRIGTQSLGREDIGAPARQWQAETQTQQTLAAGISGAADMISSMHKASLDEDANQRTLDLKKSLDMARMNIDNKQTYDLNNADDAALLRNANYTKIDASGNQRRYIDSHEVMSQVWTSQRDDIMTKGLKNLDGHQVKRIHSQLDEYIGNNDVSVAENSFKAKNNAMRSRATQSAAEAVDAGDTQLALKILAETVPFSDVERTELRQKLLKRSETNAV